MGWSREEVLAATGGRLVRPGGSAVFGEVVTDSGKVKHGSVFVALKGERLDAHRFLSDAVRRGAGCLIVHRPVAGTSGRRTAVVRVPDTLVALGDLAHYRREKLRPVVVAITGSNGKTTTKEMLAAILEEASLNGEALRGRVLKTEGNFNNLVGLPLTLLRLRRKHRIAVVELGTNHPGEIERLARIADPDLGIITSVAAAHLEGLNSLAGVAREKGTLFRHVRPEGVIAVNVDDPRVRRLGTRFRGRKIAYGKSGEVRAESVRSAGTRGVSFRLRAGSQACTVRLAYLGEHNIANAVGAAALAYGLNVPAAAIARGLGRARPYAMRMQLEAIDGIGIINDAYNANPASMKSALRTLAQLNCSGRRIAVLGDMFELGEQSEREHRALGREAAQAGLDGLYLLGSKAADVRKAAIRAGMAPQAVTVAEQHGALAELLNGRVKSGDWLLVKGSRGMRMEKVIEELRRRRAE